MGHLKSKKAENFVVAWLRAEAWAEVHQAEPSRRRLPDGRVLTRTHDLFGCFDIVAADYSQPYETWAIQVTTPSNRSKRRKKIQDRCWPSTWRVSVFVVFIAGGAGRFEITDWAGGEHWKDPVFIEFCAASVLARHAAWAARQAEEKAPRGTMKKAVAEAKRRKQEA